jgi:hypothetical protein
MRVVRIALNSITFELDRCDSSLTSAFIFLSSYLRIIFHIVDAEALTEDEADLEDLQTMNLIEQEQPINPFCPSYPSFFLLSVTH